MTTWYEHDELTDQAEGSQTQPEFAPPTDPIRSEESWPTEFLDTLSTKWTAFKTKFDSEYTP